MSIQLKQLLEGSDLEMNDCEVLLLGGTGAMGAYLSKELASLGWRVNVTSRRTHSSTDRRITYIQGNAKNSRFLKDVLSHRWYAIVDFMIYTTEEFNSVYQLMLKSCKQYFYLSSYRVFADCPLIDESSPRLLESIIDSEYLKTDEYALAKARQENILKQSIFDNWTILRPTVTYSAARLQLGALEAGTWIPRVLSGHSIPFPSQMLAKRTTMTWGGDVAKMISRLIGNPQSRMEDYNVCTSLSRTWGEIAQIYQGVEHFSLIETSLSSYEWAVSSEYQVKYDRMFNRVMNNTKVLSATGLTNTDLVAPEEGLAREFSQSLANSAVKADRHRQQGRVDKICAETFGPMSYRARISKDPSEYAKYLIGRFVDRYSG